MKKVKTRERFLDLLAQHNTAYHTHPHMGDHGKGPPHWWMYKSGQIRAGVDAACPVTYLYGQLADRDANWYGTGDWPDAARAMSLPSDIAREIVFAADRRVAGHDAELRKELLRVCYLKEVA